MDRSESSFDDFDAMAEAWQESGWDALYRQLGPGRFTGRLLHTTHGANTIYRARWGPALHQRGLQPKGTMCLAATLESQGVGRFQGQPFGSEDLIVQASCGDFEVSGAPIWDSAVFLLPKVAVSRELGAITQRAPRDLLEVQGVARMAPRNAERLRTACHAYFAAAAQPAEAGVEPSQLGGMARDLVSGVVASLAEARIEPTPAPQTSRCRQIVHRAVAFAEATEPDMLRIPEVCAELGICERSLRYAFHDLLGTSPAAFLKRERLNRVYRALRDSDPTTTLVKTLAIEHGFWHLGQFAHDYKQLFGETPSATLASG